MLSLFSPAKLNLFLHVVRRRPDGYHDLASLFQAIDFGDWLTVSLAKKDRLIPIGPFSQAIPVNSSNLVMQAISLFRRKTGLSFAVEVLLEKNIPLQAGLGGGSSNAATMLWALNQLCGLPASLDDLITWSGELGSDITFFLSNGTAYCTGRGEILRPLTQLPLEVLSKPIFVAKPLEGLSTPAVFNKLELSSLPSRDPENILQNFFQNAPEYFNDLESAALEIEPNLLRLKQALQAGGFEVVVMTGSGTCFFCIGDGAMPSWPNLLWQRVGFLRRRENTWYEC